MAPPSPLSLAVEVDNTQSRAHVDMATPPRLTLYAAWTVNGRSADRCQTGNRKKVVYEAEKKTLTDGESAHPIIIIYHHHHQPPNLNFSSVKTAFISDGLD